MSYPNKFDLLLAVTVISITWNIVSADSSHKNNFPSSDHSSNSGAAVSRSFSYANFGNSNPVEQQTHNSRGHNNHGDKITPRDTSAASSYTPGAPLPQQPDPSIALLPRGEQQNSLFAKEGSGQSNLFSGSSSTSETGEFGGSPLGFQQGLQITGFPQGSSFANLGFTPSSQSAGALQGISSGRTTQGSSIARIPQGFPLAGFQQPFGSPFGGYTQGIPLAGFPQGAAFGGFPQGATFGAYAPPGSPLGGFPQGLAFSPAPGQGFVPGAPYRGSQQGPSRASTYAFASPVAYSPQLYRQVPAQSYTSQ